MYTDIEPYVLLGLPLGVALAIYMAIEPAVYTLLGPYIFLGRSKYSNLSLKKPTQSVLSSSGF